MGIYLRQSGRRAGGHARVAAAAQRGGKRSAGVAAKRSGTKNARTRKPSAAGDAFAVLCGLWLPVCLCKYTLMHTCL